MTDDSAPTWRREDKTCAWPDCDAAAGSPLFSFPDGSDWVLCPAHTWKHLSEVRKTLDQATERDSAPRVLQPQPPYRPGMDKPGHIYYVRIDGLIKIGWSAQLPTRIAQYPPHTEYLASQPGTLADEQALHASLKEHRARGREWYHSTSTIIEMVERVAQDHPSEDPRVIQARKPRAKPYPRIPIERRIAMIEKANKAARVTQSR